MLASVVSVKWNASFVVFNVTLLFQMLQTVCLQGIRLFLQDNKLLHPAHLYSRGSSSVTQIVDIGGASPGGVPLGSNFEPPSASLAPNVLPFPAASLPHDPSDSSPQSAVIAGFVGCRATCVRARFRVSILVRLSSISRARHPAPPPAPPRAHFAELQEDRSHRDRPERIVSTTRSRR